MSSSWIPYNTYIYFISWTIVTISYHVYADTMECCRHIPNRAKYTPCKDACEQLWMSSGPLQQIELFSTAYRYCPIDNLLNFWQCIGTNYPVLTDIEIWEGRSCCELAYSTDCRLACQTASRISDLDRRCVQSEEAPLFECSRRQAGNVNCCRNIFSTQCKAACRASFVSETSSSNAVLQDNLNATCAAPDSHVNQCVSNWTQKHQTSTTLHAKSFQCCNQGATSICKQTCAQAFTSLSSQKDIIESLIPVCGQPISTEPLWQCFLLSETDNNRGRLHIKEKLSPMDGASLQCCSRAVSSQCSNLCIQLYYRRLSSVWESFSAACQYNNQEAEMIQCIQDVEEPCEVGCKDLEFCTNFNNRFDTMFRSCNKKADIAARKEYSSWLRDRVIQLPSALTIPIKDIRTCEPSLWKAISCALNVKPCNMHSNSNKICKSDCIHILSQCVDNSQTTYNIGALCDQLPVSDDENECISLHQFVDPVKSTASIDLANPCVPHPCNDTEVCEINRNYPQCSWTHRSCQPYVCRAACPVGDTSPLHIKTNYHVKMLDVESASPLNCQKVCKCGHNGFLTHCQDTYCVRADSCIPTPNSIVEHGAQFNSQCKECVCHSGEVICSRKYCPIQQSQNAISSKFGLPCGCQSSYQPVCTTNGQVLGNPCLAECAGYSDASYTLGNCAARNPCGTGDCPHGNKCVPERKVCLSSSTECPQHRCVPADCDANEHGIVCDNLGMEHPNVCLLLAERQLSYVGHCMTHCAHDGAVCGVNGETYMNECTAFASSIAVDYHSPCHANPDQSGEEVACSLVQCDHKVPDWCEGFIPPGACCPVCGSQIISLYSMMYVNKIVTYSEIPYITTQEVAEHLHHLLSSRHCQVYVYISYEQTLVILILPINKLPSKEEVALCEVDARRISNMIESKSPIITADIKLSTILTGSLYSSKIIPVSVLSGAPAIYTNIIILTLCYGIYYAIT